MHSIVHFVHKRGPKMDTHFCFDGSTCCCATAPPPPNPHNAPPHHCATSPPHQATTTTRHRYKYQGAMQHVNNTIDILFCIDIIKSHFTGYAMLIK